MEEFEGLGLGIELEFETELELEPLLLLELPLLLLLLFLFWLLFCLSRDSLIESPIATPEVNPEATHYLQLFVQFFFT